VTLSGRNARLAEILLFLAAGTAFSWGRGFATPTLGLDPGWQEALVQGTDAGRLFGVDTIFTFGPYHQLYTQQISSNQTALILGRWFYGLAWGASMVSLARISSQSWAWIVTASLALSVGQSPDATFFCFVFLFTLLATRLPPAGIDGMLITLCYVGVILGVFTKLSFLGVAAPALLLVGSYLVTQARRRRWRWHQWLMGVAIVLLIPAVLWLAAGQPLWSLSSYLMGSNLEIIRGFKGAMSSDDPAAFWQIPAYLLGATCLGILLYRFTCQCFATRLWPSLLLLNFSFLMWVVFKAGMVRHDGFAAGHAVTSGLTLAGVALLLIAYGHGEQPRKSHELISVAPLLLGLAITAQYLSPIRSYLDLWVKGMLRNTWTLMRITSGSNAVRMMLLNRRQAELAGLKRTAEKLPIPQGSTVDALPWDITDLIVNRLIYAPRPVFQSYSAYTNRLLDLNANHFRSSAAPMFLVMKNQSIDQRFPPDLDGPALVEIGKRYSFFGTGTQGGLIFKKIQSAPAAIPPDVVRSIGVLRPQNRMNGAWISDWLPMPDQLVKGSSMSLNFSPNLYRKAVAALFKPSQLWLEVRFADSHQERYRVIEGASRNLPLVPMMRTNADLRLYLEAQRNPGGSVAASSRPAALRLIELGPVRGVHSVKVSISSPSMQPP
jgi:hypothetical protein